MLVVVGSTNPVKVKAVENMFREWRLHAEIRGMEIDSGVGDQPMSDEETIQGAINRANGALQSDPQAVYGVGIEGGVTETPQGLFLCNWGGLCES